MLLSGFALVGTLLEQALFLLLQREVELDVTLIPVVENVKLAPIHRDGEQIGEQRLLLDIKVVAVLPADLLGEGDQCLALSQRIGRDG